MSLLPRRILPVLMYHRFGNEPEDDPELWIRPESFRRQLLWLRENGYRTLTLDQAYGRLISSSPAKNEVLLTIDDGFGEDLEVAAELLTEAGARAAVFVPVDLLGHQVDLRHPSGDRDTTSRGALVDRAGLRRWVDLGFDVGSHSASHVDLTTREPPLRDEEIQGSKHRLEEILQRQILDFCYPFAHHNESVRKAVQKAGYRAGYAGEPPLDNLYAVPRMMVYPRDDRARFRRKVSGHYFWMSALHQRLRRFVRH